MRTIGNVLWFLLAGVWLAIGYVVAGLIAFVLIITIPFGIAAFRLAGFVVWPFGRTAVWRREAGVWSVLGNVVWVLLLGWELALLHLVAGLVLCVTVIGIPFGIACWKMVPLALLPLGREVVPIEQADRDPYAIPVGGHPTTQTSS
ncbi:MAG TPA: YccF domain-containing protein [Jiangellales bacterium]|nr:YccF domain-containing protein [Jiangellales bacterium]